MVTATPPPFTLYSRDDGNGGDFVYVYDLRSHTSPVSKLRVAAAVTQHTHTGDGHRLMYSRVFGTHHHQRRRRYSSSDCANGAKLVRDYVAQVEVQVGRLGNQRQWWWMFVASALGVFRRNGKDPRREDRNGDEFRSADLIGDVPEGILHVDDNRRVGCVSVDNDGDGLIMGELGEGFPTTDRRPARLTPGRRGARGHTL